MNAGSETIVVRSANQRDWDRIRQLLDRAGLPVADLGPDRLGDFLVAERSESESREALGTIGLQQFDRTGLLRSLVVTESNRGAGLGQRLVRALEANARCAGVTDLWLLTIDAEKYFEDLGYSVMSRERAPETIRNTAEFTRLCPGEAYLMYKALEETGDPIR